MPEPTRLTHFERDRLDRHIRRPTLNLFGKRGGVGANFMAEARFKWWLPAVLAADVTGYSRLMGADEEGPLAVLKACRHELIDLKSSEHTRIVKRVMVS